MTIDANRFQALHDFKAASEGARAVFDHAFRAPRSMLCFMARYAAWNGLFGSGVSSLAGKIGRSRDLFREPGFPPAVADRSVLVASYFFDAARDEFDDRDTPHRDTHRCLAQATLLRMVHFARAKAGGDGFRDDDLARLFAEPLWLTGLRNRVTVGYGVGTADGPAAVFRSIGYHLGSELLADQEFSQLDASLREGRPELVQHLAGETVTIAGQDHDAYQWIRIHSGHGGGAEADHFDWALSGARRAFEYVDPDLHEPLEHQVDEGYLDFVRDHREFFERVNEP